MKAILSLLLTLCIISCSNSKENPDTTITEFSIDAVKEQIAAANKIYYQRFSNNDPAWYAERYCDSACAMPENMNAVCGIEQIIRYYYNDGKNRDLRSEVFATTIYGSKEAIVEEGTYNFPDGKGGSYNNGKFIAIWKNEKGKWKIYREIWNSNVSKDNK